MITVGVDPGKHAHGCALLSDKTLIAATLVRGKGLPPDVLACELLDWLVTRLRASQIHTSALRVVIEYPQAYRPGQQKGRQQDVVDLALYAGAVGGVIRSRFAHAECVYELPREWKKTTNPDVLTKRIEARLSAAEKAVLDPNVPPYLWHNMIDGVGVALESVGRMERVRVYE